MDRVQTLASQKAVVIFSVSTCAMCHAIKRFFCELGVSATVHELDEEPRGMEMKAALVNLLGRSKPVPTVFIKGQLIGSNDKVMARHLDGSLDQLLRAAGAKWV
eukprot:TRINITY_DN21945_c0_g1_i1.p1 TRINITY_DN21945_c0_g1~~TRINITY_DN21945_c0_g1_i1.p1  ORF type:complete len:104 (-),score=9.35 TRINITY_DN21945_c0_g1_i1:177-488(-)